MRLMESILQDLASFMRPNKVIDIDGSDLSFWVKKEILTFFVHFFLLDRKSMRKWLLMSLSWLSANEVLVKEPTQSITKNNNKLLKVLTQLEKTTKN